MIVATIEEKIDDVNVMFLVREDGKYAFVYQTKEEKENGIPVSDSPQLEFVEEFEEDSWFDTIEDVRKDAKGNIDNFKIWNMV